MIILATSVACIYTPTCFTRLLQHGSLPGEQIIPPGELPRAPQATIRFLSHMNLAVSHCVLLYYYYYMYRKYIFLVQTA
jgi:hypothetical protein